MEASREGHVVIAKTLLKEGAKVNLIDSRGKTALMYAAHKGHIVIVELLLEAGAKKEMQDMDLRTVIRFVVISLCLYVCLLMYRRINWLASYNYFCT